MAQNNLFIDEEYAYDCEHKINLYDRINNGTATDGIDSSRATDAFTKKIADGLYKTVSEVIQPQQNNQES